MDRKLNSVDVVDALTDLFILRGPPEYIRSDNWPHTPRASLRDVIARFRDELLNSEIFFSLREAAPRANDPLDRFLILGSLIEHWRRHYNTVRPHRALGYRPPAPEVILPVDQRSVMH